MSSWRLSITKTDLRGSKRKTCVLSWLIRSWQTFEAIANQKEQLHGTRKALIIYTFFTCWPFFLHARAHLNPQFWSSVNACCQNVWFESQVLFLLRIGYSLFRHMWKQLSFTSQHTNTFDAIEHFERQSSLESTALCVHTHDNRTAVTSLVLMLQTQTSLSSVYVENPLNLEMQRLDKTKNQFEFALICSSSTHQEWNLDSKFILSLFGPFFLSPIVKNMTRNA